MLYGVVNTDNFGGDYPDEKWVDANNNRHSPVYTKEEAELIAARLNSDVDNYSSRYFKVEPENYILQPGFEP